MEQTGEVAREGDAVGGTTHQLAVALLAEAGHPLEACAEGIGVAARRRVGRRRRRRRGGRGGGDIRARRPADLGTVAEGEALLRGEPLFGSAQAGVRLLRLALRRLEQGGREPGRGGGDERVQSRHRRRARLHAVAARRLQLIERGCVRSAEGLLKLGDRGVGVRRGSCAGRFLLLRLPRAGRHALVHDAPRRKRPVGGGGGVAGQGQGGHVVRVRARRRRRVEHHQQISATARTRERHTQENKLASYSDCGDYMIRT